jgi:predicted AlkP superfamily phosphohydrolase/phosphomutase
MMTFSTFEGVSCLPKQRVLAIGLDGFELSVGERLAGKSEMPALRALEEKGARVLLNHGLAKHTGLGWEHLSTGLSPDSAKRWSAVEFDPATYATWQQGTDIPPFTTSIKSRVVVFDPPYFHLKADSRVRGIVNWGAHDPGTDLMGEPESLVQEAIAKFGRYPAGPALYGLPWPSPQACTKLAHDLVEATEQRSRISQWLFSERMPDWDLAMVVVSEPHSATEALWHGVDEAHPLHGQPSSVAAAEGMAGVYRAADRLVGDLVRTFPDAAVVAFSMHGMGANTSDVTSMVLLPELLYRYAFDRPLLDIPAGAPEIPGLTEDWNDAVNRLYPSVLPYAASRFVRRARGRIRRQIGRRRQHGPQVLPLDWMPSARYQRFWPRMPAFALPSYYDGKVRINLQGREREGIVPLAEYDATCDAIEALLRQCIDPRNGDSLVDLIERPGRDPMRLGSTEADLDVFWRGTANAIEHPRFGRLGPLPFRRPGGHTGETGIAYVAAENIPVGRHGSRSSFDVVPTLIELLGEAVPDHLSGESFLSMLRAGSPSISAR